MFADHMLTFQEPPSKAWTATAWKASQWCCSTQTPVQNFSHCDRFIRLFSNGKRRSRVHAIVFSKEGYVWSSTFVPDNVGLDPVSETRKRHTRPGRERRPFRVDFDNAVGLSTAIGVLTVGTALLGIQAAVEIRRGKHYRRASTLLLVHCLAVA